MGNCCSEDALVYPEDVNRNNGKWAEEEKKVERVWQVKVRLTAKELMELAAQAESDDVIGPMLFSKCLAKGNFEVKELSPQRDVGGRREKEMNRLWTIKEEEES